MITHEKTLKLITELNEVSLYEFIATLYSDELVLFRNKWDEENLNTILLENAIWLLHGTDDEIIAQIDGYIMNELEQIGLKATFMDRAILHTIYNSYRRHNMEYYEENAIEFINDYAIEIKEYTRLKEMEFLFLDNNDNQIEAFVNGRYKYLSVTKQEKTVLKDDCPYTDEKLKVAWQDGYRLGELEDDLYSTLIELC